MNLPFVNYFFTIFNPPLEKCNQIMYNVNIMIEKIFNAVFTDEAIQQYRELSLENKEKIMAAIQTFELIGTKYKNINQLDFNLFEIKPRGVRAYFRYDTENRRVIIIGFITLKKTQEAPKRYMKQAVRNIEDYIKARKERNNE